MRENTDDIISRTIEACALVAERYVDTFNALGDRHHEPAAYQNAKTIQLVVDAIRKMKEEIDA
jgi:hypothetical protein